MLRAVETNQSRERAARTVDQVQPPLHGEAGLPDPASVCTHGEGLGKRMLATTGFLLSDEGRGKPGYVATTAGSRLRLLVLANASVAVSSVAVGEVHGARRSTRQLKAPRESNSSACRDSAGMPPHVGVVRRETCSAAQAQCSDSRVNRHCSETCGMCWRGGGNGSVPFVLWLGYLWSYEHMGRAALRCEGACECAGTVDAHETGGRFSVQKLARLPVLLIPARPAACTLSVTILPATSSGGFKFKVLSLMLRANTFPKTEWGLRGTGIDAVQVVDAMAISSTSVRLTRGR